MLALLLALAAAASAQLPCQMNAKFRGASCDDPDYKAAWAAYQRCSFEHSNGAVAAGYDCIVRGTEAKPAFPAQPVLPPLHAAPVPRPQAQGGDSGQPGYGQFGEALARVQEEGQAKPAEKPRRRPSAAPVSRLRAPSAPSAAGAKAAAREPEPDVPGSGAPAQAKQGPGVLDGGVNVLPSSKGSQPIAPKLGGLDAQDWVSRQREQMRRAKAAPAAKKAEDDDDADDE